MKIFRKRLTALGAAFVMSTSLLGSSWLQPLSVQAKKQAQEKLTYYEIEDRFSDNIGNRIPNKVTAASSLQSYKPDDEIKVIISLKEDPLLENYTKEQSDENIAVEDYLASSEVKKQREQILEEQTTLTKELKKDKDIDKFQVLCHYTTIVNGFSAKVKYKDLKDLADNKNIERISMVNKYESVEPVNSTVHENLANGLEEDIQSQYTGKGTTIAILDTGADITHEVFAGDVPQPKMDENQVKSLVVESKLHVPAEDSSNVYKSVKLPFTYDYAGKDTDVCPDEKSVFIGNAHGTHVASIAAANETASMIGTAKDAQLLILKIADETGTMEDDVILAATEDAVVLGADVINMSFGSTGGFSKSEFELEQQICDRIESAGISVSAAAGNDYDSSDCNAFGGRTLAEMPDNGCICNPASYDSATAVGSIAGALVTRPYFKTNEKEIPYNELAIYGQPKFSTFAGQSHEYCVLEEREDLEELFEWGEDEEYEEIEFVEDFDDEDDFDDEEDESFYQDADVAGKIAVVRFSNYLNYSMQIQEAENMGAIGIIIASADYLPTSIGAYEKLTIPVIGISYEYGEFLAEQENKTLEATEDLGKFYDTDSLMPSNFSSIGVTPDLKLKPEISAFGEGIYGALPFGSYGNASGTSMAAPVLSGCYAVLKEYINGNPAFSDLSASQKNALATQLLMSTAIPLKNQEGVYYSPRKIGSGLVDLNAAIKAKAFLYTDENVEAYQKPKLNLYDDPDRTGMFSSAFHLKNLGEETLTYEISYQALKEDTCKDDNGLCFFKGTESIVNDKTQLTFSIDGEALSGTEVNVEPGQDVTVEVQFQMNEELKKEYDKQMKNGGYLEGFIQLTAPDTSKLSIPYMGFYGDWTSAPIFENSDIYQLRPYIQSVNAVGDMNGNIMGLNPFDEEIEDVYGDLNNPYNDPDAFEDISTYGYDKITLSPNGDGYFDGDLEAQVSQLRGIKDFSYQLTDQKGNIVYENSEKYEEKPFSIPLFHVIAPTIADFEVSKYLEEHPVTNNEVWKLTITGTLDYDRHEQNNKRAQLTYPITIDVERPKAKGLKILEENGKRYLVLSASDNQFLAYAGLYKVECDDTLTAITGEALNEKQKGITSEIKIDLSDLEKSNIPLEECILQVFDYGMNHSVYAFGNPLPVVKKQIKIDQVQKLKVVKNNEKSIQLSWKKVKNATHYQIYGYDKTHKKYVKVKTVKSNVLSAQMKSIGGKALKEGTVYQFKVRAAIVNSKTSNYGKFSSVLYTATCTKKPVLKLVTKKGIKKLQWNQEKLANGYQVYRASSKSGKYSLVKTFKSAKNRTFTSSKNGKKYYYKVRTFKTVKNIKIYSKFSNIVAYKR